jgi:hypothetical protein
MLINFKQGILTTSNEFYLSIVGNSLSINGPLQVSLSNGDSEYLIKISDSIPNILSLPSPTDTYYIYLNIDNDANYSFGYSMIEPEIGEDLPESPNVDTHFFSLKEKQYKVWNGTKWNYVLRIFIATVAPSYNLNLYSSGISLVGLDEETNTGLIVRNQNGSPIKKTQNIKNFKFLTDVDLLYIQKNIFSEKDQELTEIYGIAEDYIPAFSLVNVCNDRVKLCSSKSNLEVTGIVLKDFYPDELVSVKRRGYVENNNWSFSTQNVGRTAWLGDSGHPVDQIPQRFFNLQQVGIICTVNSIYLDIKIKNVIGA